MGNSELEALLERQLAYLPGTRDANGCPILIVPLTPDPVEFDVGAISDTVKYLQNIPSVESRERGWVVLVDARVCPYRMVRSTVSIVRASLLNTRQILVIRPEGFWDKQRVDCRKSEADNQPIFVSLAKMTRHLDTDLSSLPIQLGGTLQYNHRAWIKTRRAYEEFVEECERSERDLKTLQAELRREEPCSHASTLHDLLTVNANTYNTITARPTAILKMGEEVIRFLETDEESGFPVREGHHDTAEAVKRVRAMMHQLHLLTVAVQSCWARLNTALNTYLEVRDLECEMNSVNKWLLSASRTLLAETRIGNTCEQAEGLQREHEAIELKCTETYGRWANLRYRVEGVMDRSEGDLRALADHQDIRQDLKSLKEYTDTLVRSFASRIDRRRTLIVASTRFHRIAEQLQERAAQLVHPGWLPPPRTREIEPLKKALKELSTRKEAIDYLSAEGNKSGEKLLDLLTVGVKDLSGRDMTPDYTEELKHVHALLTRLHDLHAQTSRHAEMQKLRLQQNIQLLSCHKDVRQAHKWLRALLEALVKAHSHVGRSSEEIRRLKTEHQHFQETAASTFEYGYESARAALMVERSSGQNNYLNPESRKLMAELERLWKMFVQGSQEQLTRLRVAGVFYRTMEQHLERLEELRNTVFNARRLNGNNNNIKSHTLGGRGGVTFAPEVEGRRLLSCRDRLLREIGRNVRLGKLLKERLVEPLVANIGIRDHNENLLAQEAISERIQHISRRAQELDTLMLPSTSSQPRLMSATGSGGSQELAKGVSSSPGSSAADQGKEDHEVSSVL